MTLDDIKSIYSVLDLSSDDWKELKASQVRVSQLPVAHKITSNKPSMFQVMLACEYLVCLSADPQFSMKAKTQLDYKDTLKWANRASRLSDLQLLIALKLHARGENSLTFAEKEDFRRVYSDGYLAKNNYDPRDVTAIYYLCTIYIVQELRSLGQNSCLFLEVLDTVQKQLMNSGGQLRAKLQAGHEQTSREAKLIGYGIKAAIATKRCRSVHSNIRGVSNE